MPKKVDPETAPARRCHSCGHGLNTRNYDAGVCFICQKKGVLLDVPEDEPATTDVALLVIENTLLAVCAEYGIALAQLRGVHGPRILSEARQVAMFILRRNTSLSKHQVATVIYPEYNGRSSIIDYSVSKIKRRMEDDYFVAGRIRRIQECLDASSLQGGY